MLQAEGFSIIEGTSKQESEATSGLQAPGDEIAWETVEAAEPAAEASTSAAPAGDLSVIPCGASRKLETARASAVFKCSVEAFTYCHLFAQLHAFTSSLYYLSYIA